LESDRNQIVDADIKRAEQVTVSAVGLRAATSRADRIVRGSYRLIFYFSADPSAIVFDPKPIRPHFDFEIPATEG
jgi:hypothetical protein